MPINWTEIFSGVAAVAAVVGMIWHKQQSAKNAGKFETQVENLTTEVTRLRDSSADCQSVAHCNQQMGQVFQRIDNAHRRMDQHETRLGALDEALRTLTNTIAANASRQSEGRGK